MIESVLESIQRTMKFQPGFPKRMVIDPRNKNHVAIQAYHDWVYDECMKRAAELTNQAHSLFDATYTA